MFFFVVCLYIFFKIYVSKNLSCPHKIPSPSSHILGNFSCFLLLFAYIFFQNLCFQKILSKINIKRVWIQIRYSKTRIKQPLSKRQKIGFQDQFSLNAGQKYCRMLQGEHSAILSTFMKLPFFINIFVLSNFDWPFNTGFTVQGFVGLE